GRFHRARAGPRAARVAPAGPGRGAVRARNRPAREGDARGSVAGSVVRFTGASRDPDGSMARGTLQNMFPRLPVLTRRIAGAALCCLLAASAARADRVQVYSITGVDCVECANPIQAQLRKLRGVRKTEF